MRRLPLLLALACLLPAAPVRADDGEGPWVVEMSRATVLASPGTPAALDAFLPGGKRPARLTWPLPPGPLLVLGLPASDPIAQRVADVFHLDVDDLAGGYRIWAWYAERRAMVFVMAADAAALHAARFEFDASAPVAMANPGMRSLDFQQPNEQAGVAVRLGSREVRPDYRIRAWAPGATRADADPMTVAGARANRLWIESRGSAEDAPARAQIGRLRGQGVTPVISILVPGQLSDASTARLEKRLAEQLRTWQQRDGIQHFALVFDASEASIRAEGSRAPVHELALARAVAQALRPGGLEELVVVPRCHSDRLARVAQPPPDLRGVPEAVIAWSGPSEHALRVTRAQAERRVAQAGGVPVVLLERWAAPFQQTIHAAYVPTLPTGRAGDLAEVLDGAVIVGRHGTEALLASLWSRAAAEVRFGASLLRELPFTTPADAQPFLAELTAGVAAADKENLGLVPWLAPLAAELAAVATRYRSIALVPVVPQRIHMDGKLDEPPWGFARSLVDGVDGVHVHVLSDGRALRLGVRVDRAVVGTRPFLLQLRVATGGRTDTWHAEVTADGVRLDRSSGGEDAARIEEGHVTSAFDATAQRYAAEITLDRFALGGEPHLGRTFEVGVSWGPCSLWPAAPESGARGLLVVGR